MSAILNFLKQTHIRTSILKYDWLIMLLCFLREGPSVVVWLEKDKSR